MKMLLRFFCAIGLYAFSASVDRAQDILSSDGTLSTSYDFSTNPPTPTTYNEPGTLQAGTLGDESGPVYATLTTYYNLDLSQVPVGENITVSFTDTYLSIGYGAADFVLNGFEGTETPIGSNEYIYTGVGSLNSNLGKTIQIQGFAYQGRADFLEQPTIKIDSPASTVPEPGPWISLLFGISVITFARSIRLVGYFDLIVSP